MISNLIVRITTILPIFKPDNKKQDSGVYKFNSAKCDIDFAKDMDFENFESCSGPARVREYGGDGDLETMKISITCSKLNSLS